MTTALLLIDVQNAVLEGMGSNDRLPQIQAAYDATTARLSQILSSARAAGMPVVMIQHDEDEGDPIAKGSEGWQIRQEVAPLAGETVINKRSCDSFYETDLDQHLRRLSVSHLVIGGCVTPYCIDTTVRRAVSLGYDVTLLSDGHMTGDKGGLTFEQIIAHHNGVLGGFGAGSHGVRLAKTGEISF
jgi:nicotinamidase-related amidase